MRPCFKSTWDGKAIIIPLHDAEISAMYSARLRRFRRVFTLYAQLSRRGEVSVEAGEAHSETAQAGIGKWIP